MDIIYLYIIQADSLEGIQRRAIALIKTNPEIDRQIDRQRERERERGRERERQREIDREREERENLDYSLVTAYKNVV